MSRFLDNLIVFGRMLRAAGLSIGTDRLIILSEALQFVDLGSREDVRAAFRSVLLQRREDADRFDRVFDEYWNDRRDAASRSSGAAAEPGDGAVTESISETLPLGAWSDIERIADKDFAELSDAERSLIRSALGSIAFSLEQRRTRRWVPGGGSRIDLRRALSRSLRTGGEIMSLPRKQRRLRHRPIVLLCDVSGSMEPYTRTLLLFAHALSRETGDVEAFLFATRLTRITMELRAPNIDAAMAAVSTAVKDWAGGTRIGEALRAFYQRWRRRTLHSSSIVILISDGWDRGDPRLLRAEIARLHRSCHRLVWLNPLIGTVDYAPLTRGLQAALPFVDDFLAVRTLRDVRDLALHLSTLSHHGHHRHLHLRRAARESLGADARPGRHRVVHPGM